MLDGSVSVFVSQYFLSQYFSEHFLSGTIGRFLVQSGPSLTPPEYPQNTTLASGGVIGMLVITESGQKGSSWRPGAT